MSYSDQYQSKKVSPNDAVASIKSGSKLLVAMAAGAPPALMEATANRVRSGDLKDLDLYYKLAPPQLIETLLSDDVLPRLNAHTFFVSGKEREIIKKQSATGKKLLSFVPVNFSQIPMLVTKMAMVTDDRMDVEHIVTEYGVVNLRGLSTEERAKALISIAHPQFRDVLTAAARKVVLI